ncbi:MAG TPA: hypothetical protein VG651_24055 [Stellaceae bacterium]|nr:hypothetical protein [Stellaceae bacterium]
MLTIRDYVDIIHGTMNAPLHRRAAVFDALVARAQGDGALRKRAAELVDGILIHKAEVVEMVRAEQDRAAHAHRRRAGDDPMAKAAHDEFEQFKRSLATAPLIRPWGDR